MTGLAVLNVGAGDTKLSFDPDVPEDRQRAALVVADMLKRGYAILVEVGTKDGKPLYQRIEAFDVKTCEYIIVGVPEGMLEPERLPKAKWPRRRLKAETTSGVAVARSAGG
jgi:hypothetical protein